MGLSKQEQAEMVLAALDRRHQTEIHCYCGGWMYFAPIFDYRFAESECALCGRRWCRVGTESWSYWHMVDKRGRSRHGLRGKFFFTPSH